MTKSRDKAKEGWVKITHNREEWWVDPKDILIDDKTLGEIKSENHALQVAFDKYKKKTNEALGKLLATQKKLEEDVEKYKQSVVNFMTDVVKGGY